MTDGQEAMANEGMAPAENQDYDLDFSGTSEEPQETEQNLSQQVQETEQVEQSTEQVNQEQQLQEGQPDGQLTDVEALQKQLNDALGIISQYKQSELAQQPTQQPQDSQQKPEQTLKNVEPGQVVQLDFLQGQDHIEILKDPEQFNNLLCQVATVSFNAAVNAAQEQVMRKIPEIVQSAAQQQSSISNITRDFYAKNPDLDKFRPAVSMAAMQLYNENPNLQLPELLQGAAQRTREMLRLNKSAVQRGRQPAQPAGGSIRSAGGNRQPSSTSQITDQEQQILDLLNF